MKISSEKAELLKSRVLFVCTGNICRSPTAAGFFKKLIRDAGLAGYIDVDSAGTHNFHVGESPDARAKSVAEKHGFSLEGTGARMVELNDFYRFDHILAMDWDNLTQLRSMCPPHLKHKLQLLMRYASDHEEAVVPDPYYGGVEAFHKMISCIEDACGGLFDLIQKRASQYVMLSA
jgi:protein-tyrosine phosphatase